MFVENFVPGKLSELGFGYDHLRQMNSGLIYASISGFGSHGTYYKKPGYDVTASAYGGLISITGPKVCNLVFYRKLAKFKKQIRDSEVAALQRRKPTDKPFLMYN